MKEIIVANKLVKIYGDKNKVRALDEVSLTVNESDFICIMGPSGSGKSTFLNVIASIDSPNKGEVIYKGVYKDDEGVNLYKLSERKIGEIRSKNVGFIFQEFNLIDSLTIRENIAVPLAIQDKPKEEINNAVEELAKKLNIFETLDKFPVECSGGQKQRAAAARALIINPKIIVADEPTGNLDTRNSHELLGILKERNENDGVAILMVTHDSMVASYSKKLVFLRDGKIDEIIERGDLSQNEFFYKIVEVTARESQNLFNIMGK